MKWGWLSCSKLVFWCLVHSGDMSNGVEYFEGNENIFTSPEAFVKNGINGYKHEYKRYKLSFQILSTCRPTLTVGACVYNGLSTFVE